MTNGKHKKNKKKKHVRTLPGYHSYVVAVGVACCFPLLLEKMVVSHCEYCRTSPMAKPIRATPTLALSQSDHISNKC